MRSREYVVTLAELFRLICIGHSPFTTTFGVGAQAHRFIEHAICPETAAEYWRRVTAPASQGLIVCSETGTRGSGGVLVVGTTSSCHIRGAPLADDLFDVCLQQDDQHL